MATKNTPHQDLFEKNRYDITAVKKSQAWFAQQVTLLARKRITPNQVVNNNPANNKSVITPGKLYMFFYDPKTKDTLPYYDKFPLVFPFAATPDGFIGLNLHYLPHKLRFTLMDRLLQFKNNDKFDETTKLRYSWAMINGVSKFALAKPCVKRYLKGHLRSSLVQVSADDWATALMLPVERFVGAPAANVWQDSIRKTK